MRAPLDQAALNQMWCQAPGCDHSDHSGQFYIHAACHPRAGMEVMYDRTSGTMMVGCRTCHRRVAEIAVAS